MKKKFILGVILFLVVTVLSGWVLLQKSEFSPIDQKASDSCDKVVGGGSGEYADINSALNSLGGNLSGKTICIRNNKIYSRTVIQKKSGSVSSPLIIKSHPTNTSLPQFRDDSVPSSSNAYTGTIEISESSHIVIEGLEVAKSPANGFDIRGGSSSIVLRNIVVHDNYLVAIRIIQSQNITVDGCIGYNYKQLEPNSHILSTPEAFNAVNSASVLIQNCKIWNGINKNGGGGVLATLRSENITYRNNEVYSPFVGPVLHTDQSKNILYENNLVVGYCNTVGGLGFYWLDEPYPEKDGFGVNPDRTQYPWRYQNGQDITVRNNLLVGMNSGINIGGCQSKGAPGDANHINGECIVKNLRIVNNTVIGIKENSLTYSSNFTKPPQGLEISNNIFHTVGSSIAGTNSPGGGYFINNIWSLTPYGEGKVPNDKVVNNLQGVFATNINPSKCIEPGMFNINDYRVSTTYKGKGADIDKVGNKVELPAISKEPIQTPKSITKPNNPQGPTSTPKPVQTPSPTVTNTKRPTSTVSPKPEGNKCGSSDVNGDGRLTLIDFSEFAIKYKIGNTKCSDTREEYIGYGKCGGKDVDRSGVLDIKDFGGYLREGGYNIGFARRYFPKESCELPKEWHNSIKDKP